MASAPNSRTLLLLVSLSHVVNHLNATAITFMVSAVIAKELGLNKLEVGFVAASALATMGFLQLAFGVAGRYYARRLLLALGNVVMGVGSALTGLAINLYQLLTFRVIWGVGASAQHPIGASLLSDNFEPKLRGRALGLHSGLALFGNIFGPGIAIVAAGLAGWRNALLLLGFPLLAMVPPILSKINETRTYTPNNPAQQQKLGASLKNTLRDRNVSLILLTEALAVGTKGLAFTLVFLPLLLADEFKYDQSTQAAFTTIFLMGGGLGPFIYGWLSDRFGRRPVAVLAIVATALLTYSITLLREGGLALAFVLAALGSSSFAVTSILQTFLSETVEPSTRDIAFSFYFAFGAEVNPIWTLFMGFIIEFYGYGSAFTLAAVLTALSAAFLPLAPGKRFK